MANAVEILRCLSTVVQPSGVSEVSKITGISPSTVFNILRTLEKERLVDFSDTEKTYRPALGLLSLALGRVGRNCIETVCSELEGLSLRSRMSVGFWRLGEKSEISLILRFSQCTRGLDFSFGGRQPELIGAAGYCIAALRNMTDEELQEGISSLNWGRAPSLEQYKKSIQASKDAGWSIDQGRHFLGISCVAAVVVDCRNLPRFVVSAHCASAQASISELKVVGQDLSAVVGAVQGILRDLLA